MKKFFTFLVCLLACWASASAAGYAYTLQWTGDYTYRQDGNTVYALFKVGSWTSSAVYRTFNTVDASKVHITANGQNYVTGAEIADVTIGSVTNKGLKITISDVAAGTYMFTLDSGAVTFTDGYGYTDSYNNAFEKTIDLVATGGGGGGNDPVDTYTDVNFGDVSFPYYGNTSFNTYWGTGVADASPRLVAVAGGTESCTLTGTDGDVAFTTAPAVGVMGNAGKLTFQIADATPAGDYILTIPKGYFKLGDNEYNEAAEIEFHYGEYTYTTPTLGDVNFAWYGNSSFRGYWGMATITCDPEVAAVNSGLTCTLQGPNGYVYFKNAPAVGANANKGQIVFWIDDDNATGDYILTIPKGYFTLSNGDLTEELTIPFHYGPAALPAVVFTATYNDYIDGDNIQFLLDPEGVVVSGKNANLKNEAGETLSFTTQPYLVMDKYLWIAMPAGLKEEARQRYTVEFPEGYFQTTSNGAPNQAFSISFEWGTAAAEPEAAEIPYVACSRLAKGSSQVYSNHSETAIDSFQTTIMGGSGQNDYLKNLTIDSSKKVSIKDGEGNDVSVGYTGSTYSYYFWTEGLNIQPTTPPTYYTVTIPEGMLTWEDEDGNLYYNVETELADFFSVGKAPAVETPVITIDGGDVTITTATEGATIKYNYSVYDDDYEVYAGDFNTWNTEEASTVTFTIDFGTAPAGATILVQAKAEKEGMSISATASANETYYVTFAAPTYEVSDGGILIPEEEEMESLPGTPLLRGGSTITVTNPNGAGQIEYSVNGGETVTSEESSVELTVPSYDPREGNVNYSFTAKVVPASTETYYKESEPLEFEMQLTVPSLVAELNVEGADVKVFTLDGTQVKAADLQPGLYIVVREGKSVKTLVK